MTRRFRTSTLPIHRRLPLLMLLACSTTVLVASALYLTHDMLGFRRHMDNQLASIARIVALNSTAALMFQDRDTGAQVLTALRDEKGIMGVAIYGADGALFASFEGMDHWQAPLSDSGDRSPPENLAGQRIIKHPIEMEGETLGHVRICASTAPLRSHAYSYLHFVLVVVLAVSVIAFYLSRFMLGQIVTPLAALTDAAKSVTRDNDYSVRVAATQSGDMAELIAAFNAMLDEIDTNSNALVAHQDRLRALSQNLQTAEENERRALAAALHDSVCQTLFGIQMELSAFAATLDGVPGTKASIQSLRDHVTASITEARSITTRLTPSGLEELGLMSALKGAATDLLEHTHIDVTLHDNSSGKELSAKRRILTFRCVQELMRNISKHANARNVMIELNDGEGALRITVRDDGDGFDPETVLSNNRTNGGFGLFSIVERISFAGGTVDLASTPGEGAAITLKLPFAEDGLSQAP